MFVFRILISILALVSPFFFPAIVALLIAAVAAYFVPYLALIVGVLIDTLYFGGGMPYFTILGAIIAVGGYFVQQFVKTRII